MNIVQFTPNVGERTGRERMMERIAKGLDAGIYTLSKDYQENEKAAIPKGYNQINESIEKAEEISVEREELDSADIIIAHSSLAVEILDNLDAQIVLMSHGYFKELTSMFEEALSTVDNTHEFFVRSDIDKIREEAERLLSKADLLIANSEYVKRQIDKWFGLDSVVVYDAIDWQFYHPVKSNGDYFLWVGRQFWLKRPEVVLKAFEQTDRKLHIASSAGPYSEQVASYSNSMSNVTHHGYVSNERLRELYSGANALIHTSYDEDCPTVIREAMACGTPSIATNAGASKEVMQGEGELVSYDNPAPEIVDLVESFDENKYDSSKLREKSKKFSVESVNNELKSAIDSNFF